MTRLEPGSWINDVSQSDGWHCKTASFTHSIRDAELLHTPSVAFLAYLCRGNDIEGMGATVAQTQLLYHGAGIWSSQQAAPSCRLSKKYTLHVP